MGRNVVKPVRRACARGSKFGQDASLTHVASRRARAVRAKCSLAGLTSRNARQPRRGAFRRAVRLVLFVLLYVNNTTKHGDPKKCNSGVQLLPDVAWPAALSAALWPLGVLPRASIFNKLSNFFEIMGHNAE